jgi:hypothetical protein
MNFDVRDLFGRVQMLVEVNKNISFGSSFENRATHHLCVDMAATVTAQSDSISPIYGVLTDYNVWMFRK